MAQLADLTAPAARPAGVRVLLDARTLQEPTRAPITAQYVNRLLGAFADRPLPAESFILLLRLLREDPTEVLEARGLAVAGRRKLPPTSRTFRSAGLTVDSFLLRGASIRGAARGAGSGDRTGSDADAGAGEPIGSVFHTPGGAVPIRSGLPVVATLLDLAPWELPDRYASSAAARVGHRLRAHSLRDASRVICASRATADAAVELLGLRPEQLEVVPLAADAAFRPDAADAGLVASMRARYDLPERYLVFAGRYDARKDLATLFEALAGLRQEAHPRGAARNAPRVAWPPVVVLAGAGGTEHEEAPAVARAARQAGVADMIRLTPRLEPEELAALEAASIGHVQPALSDGTGLAVLEALAVGVPVIASRVGALPENVATAGILVEPRDAPRLATAIRALWEDGSVARQVTRAAAARANGPRRTWADVAEETRRVYAAAAEGPARLATQA
jgi:glycosyltransferase involved in cell wall biosynthesis